VIQGKPRASDEIFGIDRWFELDPLPSGDSGKVNGEHMTASETIRDILDPGVEAVEEEHSEIKDAMNLLGRVVAAIEYLAERFDELSGDPAHIPS
jgi:hypothetical protein